MAALPWSPPSACSSTWPSSAWPPTSASSCSTGYGGPGGSLLPFQNRSGEGALQGLVPPGTRHLPGKGQPWEVAALWSTRPGSEGSSERAVFPAKGSPLVWASFFAPPWALHLPPDSHMGRGALGGWQFGPSFCQPAAKQQLWQGRVAGQAPGFCSREPLQRAGWRSPSLVGSRSLHPFPSPPVKRSEAGRRDPLLGLKTSNCASRFQQLNSFANYQFLFLDLAITTVIGMTSKPGQVHARRRGGTSCVESWPRPY